MQRPSLVSAYPSIERAELARRSFYFKILSSLAYLTSVAGKGGTPPNISNLVRMPLGAEALNPRLFYLHDMLLSAMRIQDSHTVSRLVNAIEELAEDGVHRMEVKGPEVLSVQSTDWEQFIVQNSKDLGEEFFKARPEIDPVASAVADQQANEIRSAIELIKQHFKPMHDELSVFLNKVRIFSGTVTMGITDVRMFGCMFIRVPRDDVTAKLYYAEHLTHEISHMYLNAAMAVDPILLNDRSELFTSPLRPDPRPMIGVFHATFVTARIVQLFSALASSEENAEGRVYLYQQLDELRSGVAEIRRGAKLTDTGLSLLEEFEQIACAAEALPFWSEFDQDRVYAHRFGGGAAFRPAAKSESSART